jgi:hypothetical protein
MLIGQKMTTFADAAARRRRAAEVGAAAYLASAPVASEAFMTEVEDLPDVTESPGWILPRTGGARSLPGSHRLL